MSGRKPRVGIWRDAIRESDLGATPKLVAFVVSTFVNGRGGAYPSRATLAAGASLSVKAVDNALRRLERDGFLEISRTRGRTSNSYAIILPSTANEVRRSEWVTANEVPRSGAANGEPDGSNGESDALNGERGSPKSVESAESGRRSRLRGARPRLVEDDCMACFCRRTLYEFNGRLLCETCVLAYTGELQGALDEHILELRAEAAT